MNPATIRIAAEAALVLGTAGLLLELIQSHSWAVILANLSQTATVRGYGKELNRTTPIAVSPERTEGQTSHYASLAPTEVPSPL